MSEHEFETRTPLEHRAANAPEIPEIAVDTTPTPAESTRLAVPTVNIAAPNAPMQEGWLSYHVRAGSHALTEYDWGVYLDFADARL